MEFCCCCSECGHHFPIQPQVMVCPDCSRAQTADQPLRGVLEVELAGTVPADWEIASLLPVEERFFPPIPVGTRPSGRHNGSGTSWSVPASTSRMMA